MATEETVETEIRTIGAIMMGIKIGITAEIMTVTII
jgi:hypothetical protein